jgi:hypothetical protein
VAVHSTSTKVSNPGVAALSMTTADEIEHRGWTRRRFLTWGLGGATVVGMAGATGISPAIWTSYDEAQSANAGAFASEATFREFDAVTHVGPLAGKPVRVASGTDDPFHPGVVALSQVLPRPGTVTISSGCHAGPFFTYQETAITPVPRRSSRLTSSVTTAT